jgi:hypothetical protein
MKKFPVTVVDNFYENPDLVRDFALSLPYFPSEDGRWPGARSDNLSEINENFFKTFSNKLLSLFYDFNDCELEWIIETSFQQVCSFSDIKTSILNQGWIHSDGESIFSGVVYLNPNPKEGWGTSIYKLKNGEVFDCEQRTKFLHYSGSKDFNEEEFEEEKQYNNNKFVESIKIENVYNRLILFEGGEWHGVPSFYSDDDEPRLTQVFFVEKLKINGRYYPIVRSKLSNL